MPKRIVVIILILSTILTAVVVGGVYAEYQEQVAQQNEVIQETFREVLTDEVARKSKILSLIPNSYHSVGTSLIQSIPDTVYVTSETMGKRAYRIVPYRFEHSLYKETKTRGDISYILYKHLLSVDTLSHHLDSVLREKAISVPTSVRYTYIDLEERSSAYFAPSEKRCLPQDSLTTWYLGFRCEGEVTAYSHPHAAFWNITFGEPLFYLLFPIWLLAFLLIRYPQIIYWMRCKFVKKEVVIREVVVEKRVSGVDVELTKAELFNFSPTSSYDASTGILRNGELTIELRGMSQTLLTAFLRSPNHQLTEKEIYALLWNGGGNKGGKDSRIHYLRTLIKKSGLPIIIKSNNGIYWLDLSDSDVNSSAEVS